ncbi:hypothetical protein BDFG_08882 [Blastomyces dermatitidis ATCC 26199]|nr:hypothetical protein BDFG_08882 [Blastomyces dermatitidis ATCC 26199]
MSRCGSKERQGEMTGDKLKRASTCLGGLFVNLLPFFTRYLRRGNSTICTYTITPLPIQQKSLSWIGVKDVLERSIPISCAIACAVRIYSCVCLESSALGVKNRSQQRGTMQPQNRKRLRVSVSM